MADAMETSSFGFSWRIGKGMANFENRSIGAALQSQCIREHGVLVEPGQLENPQRPTGTD